MIRTSSRWARPIALITGVLVAAAALVAAPLSASAATGDTISGHVYFGVGTGSPVAGIDVALLDADGDPVADDVLSESDGTYSFTTLDPGDYTLTFTDIDEVYLPYTVDVTLGDTNVTQDAHLTKAVVYTVKGTATVSGASSARPADGVYVELQRSTPDGWVPTDSTTVDVTSTGSAAFTLSSIGGYTYRVEFSVDVNYSVFDTASFELNANATGKNGTIAKVSTHTIGGTVSGIPTKSAATVIAYVSKDGGWVPVNQARPSSTGVYSVRVSDDSDYRVYFFADDDAYLPQVYNGINTLDDPANVAEATTVHVASANIASINATLVKSPHITGVVKDTDNSIVAGAIVSLIPYIDGAWDESSAEQIETDSAGAFDFGTVEPGASYTLGVNVDGLDTAGVNGYLTGTASLPANGDSGTTGVVIVSTSSVSKTLTLAPAPTVTGLVTTSGGTAIAGATVDVYKLTDLGAWGYVRTLTTNDAGQFTQTFRSPLANYTVRVTKPGYVTQWYGNKSTAFSAAAYEYNASAPVDFTTMKLASAAAGITDGTRSFCTDNTVPLGSGTTSPVDLGLTANFYGSGYTQTRVSTNGMLLFGSASTSVPADLTNSTSPIIAAYSAATSTLDPTTPVENAKQRWGYVTYGHSSTEFCAIWHGVSPTNSVTGTKDTVNSYQVVLTTRGDRAAGDFDIFVKYGTLAWADGGVSAGFTAGSGVSTQRSIVSTPGTALASTSTTYEVSNAEEGTLLITSQPVTASGVGGVGQTLTATTDAWTPATVTLSYQWLRNGSPIAQNATSSTYVVTDEDQGSTLSVRVTGTRSGGYADTQRTSNGIPVPLGTLTSQDVTIAGTTTFGSVLTSTHPDWSPAPVALSYQWLRDDAPIVGAVADTYTVSAADGGHTLALKVSGSKDHYAGSDEYSNQIAIPLATMTINTPTITGTPLVGKKLVASVPSGSQTGLTATYHWLRNGHTIVGFSTRYYTLRSYDAGSHISVYITVTKTGYTPAKSGNAKGTATVLRPFTKAPTPTISGTAKVGSTLTAKPGTWSPKPTFTYRWYANGKPISGAIKSTYKPTTSTVGKTITVVVTGKKTGYLTVVTKASKPTKKVIR
jgi:hypothetical protein